MKFDAFEARLNDLLDQRRNWESDPEVARLIRDSAEHRALATAYGVVTDRRTLERIDRLPACRVPADLAQRVLAELQGESVEVRPHDQQKLLSASSRADRTQAVQTTWEPPRWFSVVLAVAATLLVALGLSQLVPNPGTHGTQIGRHSEPAGASEQILELAPAESVPAATAPSQLVAAPSAPLPTDVAPTPEAAAPEAAAPEAVAQSDEPTIGALMNEARNKYADLARDTQQAVSEVAILLPGFGTRSSGSRTAATAAAGENVTAGGAAAAEGQAPGSGAAVSGAAGDAPGGWAGNVGEGLEPLTRSAVGALDFILQALPAGNVEPKS